MILFFDTETTGLPPRRAASDLRRWPRLVEIAWILDDPRGSVLREEVFLVRPEGFRIPPAASRVHGITTERARRHGRPLDEVLDRLEDAARSARTVVAHNLAYDARVVAAECARLGRADPLAGKRKRCTMRETTRLVGIRHPYHGTKWPTLAELHSHLFGKPHDDAHGALADARACRRCFLALGGGRPPRGLLERLSGP